MTKARHPIVFVADDGPRFGLGRLRRLEFLKRSCTSQTRELIRLVSRDHYRSSSLPRAKHRPFWMDVRDLIVSEQPRLCVFDIEHSEWEACWNQIRSSLPRSSRAIGIDVPPDWINNFDEVIHPGVSAPPGYRQYTHWHGGPKWVLVDRHPTWNPNAGESRVTATTGSQDFNAFFGWLEKELEVLANRGAKVSWVVGKHDAKSIGALTPYRGLVDFVNDDDLIQRFTSSTLVLARFGVTVFELGARGVPTIILPSWHPKESPEIIELEKRKVVLVAKSKSEIGVLGNQLLRDAHLREALSQRSMAYFGDSAVHPAADLIDRLAL
jgi:hypothetical protein